MLIKAVIEITVKELVEVMGAEADVLIDVGYPTVYNDEGLHIKTKKMAADFMGEQNVEETEVRMGAEDLVFTYRKFRVAFLDWAQSIKKKSLAWCTRAAF